MNSENELAYKHFFFPLNVYALALQLEEGSVESLHYGLFEHESESVSAAQKRSTELLFSYFPEAPARILEVGCGIGTTFKQMQESGYQVTGINPDINQMQVARKRLGQTADLVVSRLEDFDVSCDPYDVVMFQESAQYINPLDIFDRSFDLLVENGELLILDEVCLRSEKSKVAHLHMLESMLSVAKRCGFELIEHIDLSHQAIHTLDYLLNLIDKHGQKIEDELGINDEVLARVRKINRDYKRDYDAGVYGYAFLRFRKLRTPKWHIGLSTIKDVASIQKLFSAVFNEKMSDKFWHWKYAGARGQEVLAWKGEELVSHYGGMSREALFFGEPCMICQNGDVMVAESERGALTRQGPFFLACATYLELFIGYGKRHLLGYGFPNRRAMKVATRLGLYEEVDTMSEVRWQAGRKSPKLKTRIRNVDPLADRELIQSLWLKMKDDLNDFIVGVRDFSYLQHRYLNHPEKEYQVILLTRRLGGSPYAVIVLRPLENECELVDYIGPLKHLNQAIDQARRMTFRWQKKSLFSWITTHQASRFAGTEGEITDLDISIPSNVWSDGPKPEELNARWWLMSGDTDFR